MTTAPSRGQHEVDPTVVVLVGFMGAGKTTIGRELAGRLGWRFVDADDELERRAGRSITSFFEAGHHRSKLPQASLLFPCRTNRKGLHLSAGIKIR